MRILLAGASGLVGGSLLPLLAAHEVTVVGRRKVAADVEQLVAAAENWPDLIGRKLFDVAISCLGTTIRAAGSRAAFASVDRDTVVALAEAAHRAGAQQFLLVSSVGASVSASNFYLRTKGEAEAGVNAVGFHRVDIFRPGLLRGDRGGLPRPGERAMIALSPLTDRLLPASLAKYRSIAADDVATAIAALVGRHEPGAFAHHNGEMLREVARIG